MTRALFISMDGPKGTGKTTLLEAVTTALRADNIKVVRLCERKSDPCRAQTMALVNTFARDPSRDLELEVCERFADSRSWITQNVLAAQPSDSIILMDRWYPSDAGFRRLIPFADILELNINRQVQVPDLHVGVVTAAQISWARAAARRRGLSSTVMFKLEEQVVCTEAFERAAVGQGWVICRNEGTIEEAMRRVVSQIYKVL
ncbi:thymidylate kinase [Pseudomonas lactis]|uniref:dTMP kinase n=1 Tax=Pseudomonas lactis TaxID=1615674 RepID=UPI000B7067BD|nr:dTMP kinase [Pseudomonas lactis]OWQ40472.1 thymidylate kinase [Pseudomonas lactis]